jgi:hypothetical protein
MRKKSSILAGMAIIAAILACNMPSSQQDSGAIMTAAALTVQAQLSPTVPATAAATNTSAPFPTVPQITSTPFFTATPLCDLAQFVKDVNIPDGTVMSPNQTFTKTWRLSNIGVCTWSGYNLIFDSGDLMGGTSPIAIGTVSPGQDVDLSVNLTAPASNGKYRGYWRIRNPSGVLIPVASGYQGKSFYVDVKVAVTSPGFDLHTRAPAATWISCGSPCGGGTTLTFGGPDTDANGFALYRNGERLEDGSTPGKVLETHPMWVDDGVISGLYVPYTVVAGEHFSAKIGFLAAPDGSCGTGNAIFQFNYKESGTIHPLGTWTETCNGTLRSVDVDLSSIAGHNVQFTLAVLANGSSSQDWAVWVSPQVAIP